MELMCYSEHSKNDAQHLLTTKSLQMIATTLDELSRNSRSMSEEKVRPEPPLVRIINTVL